METKKQKLTDRQADIRLLILSGGIQIVLFYPLEKFKE